MSQEIYTITYGEQAENHHGMQKIGKLATEGFNLKDLQEAEKLFKKQGLITELIDLTDKLKKTYNPTVEKKKKTPQFEDAHILIIRNGVDTILKPLKKTKEDMLLEQQNIDYDTKACMYGRVVNKTARYNVCFNGTKQEPDYANNKGRIVAFKDVKLTNYIRTKLSVYLGHKAKNLKAEGNHYYDVTKTGIGFHGDAERMKVIGVRLGNVTLPLHYQWFYKNLPIGDRIILDIHPGDIYIMTQKTTGNDWKKKTIYTLRHATGAKKYITIKETKPKLNSKLMKELEKYDLQTLDIMFDTLKKNKVKTNKDNTKLDTTKLDTTN